mmetsp:Transcript_10023/g.11541  ORF Transcript_10023/g.11541 Transcript_10023/m.11541 type:complete len:455 (+) Transcript_10023:613-1977(+)
MKLKLRNGDILTIRHNNSAKAEAAVAVSSSIASPKVTYKATMGSKRSKGKTNAHGQRRYVGDVNSSSMSSTSKPKRQYVRRGNAMQNKGDIAERLIASTEKWSYKDPVEKFLRKAHRLAVKKQYEIAEGNKRYAAALSGEYEFVVLARKLSGEGSHYKARYKAGPNSRSYDEDEFDMLGEDLVKRAFHDILGTSDADLSEEERRERREKLKPFFIAEISPQMFWSLLHIIGKKMGFKQGLQRLIPEVNWDFIEVRHRKISEKAKESRANEEYAKNLRARRSKRPRTEDKQQLVGKTTTQQVPSWIPKELCQSLSEAKIDFFQFCLLDSAEKTNLRSKLEKCYATCFNDLAPKSAAEDAGIQLEAWIKRAQEHFARDLVKSQIIPSNEIRNKLKELLHIETVYDVMRLKVPGRIELAASELGTLENATKILQSAQKSAEDLLNKFEFLNEYRSRG